ncbi:flagellin [Ignisphaera aggregans DSM 17230]|uniref:Flagellin n=1 Tax=Ignisphaera aggregans (strain DSM 17230 / JCM 13409 / AQ1.S1) TaxID=583356 RepID=E0SRS0_IGNAA|nr:flagellin [Ignisphaera aggregans DSM 17230]
MGKTNRKTLKRGIVGIEAAIVMIAFVIVAAALAFVVLNMGFFTTQQSRQVMQRGLGESSSALMVDGSVVATVDTSISRISYIYVPIKLSTGQYMVDLTPGKSIVGYWSPQRGIAIANTYLMAVLTPVDTPDTLANITKTVVNLGETQEIYNLTKDPNGNFYLLTPNTQGGTNTYDINSGATYKIVSTMAAPKISGKKGDVLKFYVYECVSSITYRKITETSDQDYNLELKSGTASVKVKFDGNPVTQTYKGYIIYNEPLQQVVTTIRAVNGTSTSGSTITIDQNAYYVEVSISCSRLPYAFVIGLPDDVDSTGLTFKEFFAKFAGGKVVTVMDWVAKVNDDTVLDPGEKILMLTYYNDNTAMPQSYDTIKLEVRVPIGAPLTIERNVPPSLTQGVVDLG